MKTAAVLMTDSSDNGDGTRLFRIQRKDPGDISGSNGNGSGIVDGYPSEENGPAGENSNENTAARIAVTQKIRKTVKIKMQNTAWKKDWRG